MQYCNYYNGLGELIQSPILSVFFFKGVQIYVVLDRLRNPTLIYSADAEKTWWVAE